MKKNAIIIFGIIITLGFASSYYFMGENSSNYQSDFAPSWSPDGKRMVFYSYRNGLPADIFVANTDGTNEMNITNSPSETDTEPAWSPDGNFIAYGSGATGRTQNIVLYNINTGTKEIITAAETENKTYTSPTWTNDSKGLYVSWKPAKQKGQGDIAFIDLDSKNITEVTRISTTQHFFSRPFLNKEGNYLSVSSNLINENREIYIIDKNGNIVETITDLHSRSLQASIGPDNQILYSSNVSGNYDIYLWNSDTKKSRNLSQKSAESEWFPRFSPDGKNVYFTSKDTKGNNLLYKLNLEEPDKAWEQISNLQSGH